MTEMIELSQDVIEKANEKVVQIYYQQAIETYNGAKMLCLRRLSKIILS